LGVFHSVIRGVKHEQCSHISICLMRVIILSTVANNYFSTPPILFKLAHFA